MANQEFTPTTNSSTTNVSASASTTERAKQQAKDAVDGATQQAKDVAARAKEGAKEGANQAADEAKKMAGELSGEVKQMASDAAHQAEGRVNEQKGYAADRLAGVANALRESGNSFRSQDEEAFATYADGAADQVERFSGYLRDQNVNDLARDVKQLAKRQPELFVAGALAAGFFLGRFFKSSEQQRSPAHYRGGYPGQYDAQGTNRDYRPAYNQTGSSAYGNQSNYGEQYNDRYSASAYGESAYGSRANEDQSQNNRYADERYRAQNQTENYSSNYGASYGTGTVAGSTTQQAATEDVTKSSVQYEPHAYAAASTVTNKPTEGSKNTENSKNTEGSKNTEQNDQNSTRKEK